MDGKKLLPFIERKVLDAMDNLDAGIAYQDVDRAELLDNLGDAVIDLGFAGDIHGEADRLARSLSAEVGGRRFRSIFLEIGDGDDGAFLHIALGNGKPDAAR